MSEKELYTNHLHASEPRWFAVYTSVKREKLAHKLLSQKGIHCYLPLLKVTRRYTRKIRTLQLPLISCYLFVKIVRSEYVPVLETEHVLRYIRFSKNLISIPEEEINLIKRVVGEDLPLDVAPTAWHEGDDVEVIAGNLTGLRGKLVALEGKKHFVVELQTLGYSLRMTIDPAHLHKLNKPAAG